MRFLVIKMKSKSKISKQLKRKTNPLLVETINLAKKNDKWLEISQILSGPRKRRSNLNIADLNRVKKDIVVPGKILSQGEIDKKIKIVALGFSKKAEEKLKKAGCEISTIAEEINKNPNMSGLEIFKKQEKIPNLKDLKDIEK